MSKYVIDLRPDCKVVQQICASEENVNVGARSVGLLDALTDDYVKENFKYLLDAEYHRGLEEGNDIGYKDGVKDGQNEAWECAKKLFSTMSETEIEKVFPTEWNNGGFNALINLQPQEAIAKLKAHEEKQKADDEIKRGDVIANNTEPKLKVWVTCFDEIGFCGIAITDFGTVDEGKLYSSCSPKGWHKIGHFDITKILEDMRHD